MRPAVVLAQGLPAYRPINPVATSRSGLGFEPFRVPVPGRWQADIGMEYASTIEFNESSDVSYLLDSELFRTRAKVYHDLSTRTFLLAEAELLGAYSGVLDGFLEWYHGLLGIEIPERERRPKNHFLYAADLAGESPVQRRAGDLFLGVSGWARGSGCTRGSRRSSRSPSRPTPDPPAMGARSCPPTCSIR